MNDLDLTRVLTWAGIALCLSQSAMFSGLNLALFGVSRLRLETEVATGNEKAQKLLNLRKDSNFLLATILWGNVASNCLLTLLSDSVLAGIAAFLFSTILITVIGEILPQAYFSRHALQMTDLLSPVLRGYQFLLYPVTKPTGLALDWWLGKAGLEYYRERELREVIKKHIEAKESDVDHVEGRGALNFMSLDDLPAGEEGEPVASNSIVSLPFQANVPVFPEFNRDADDPFVLKLLVSGKKWVILTDPQGEPQLVLDADEFARELLIHPSLRSPIAFCHRPIVVRDPETELGKVIHKLKIKPQDAEDDVIDDDIILLWGKQKRIITGADILGRLMRGIVTRETKGD